MNKADWNAFVDANEAQTLTLTLDQRNLISAADEHINWLESRKQHSERQVKNLRTILQAVSMILTRRGQPGWEEQLLAVVDKVLEDTKQ